MRKHFSTLMAAVVLLCLGSFSFAADTARVPTPALYGVKMEAPRYAKTTSVQAEAAKATVAHACSEVARQASRMCDGAPAAEIAGKSKGFARSYVSALSAANPFSGSPGVLPSGGRTSATLNS